MNETTTNVPLFDVIAVRMDDNSERVMATGMTEANAEAFVKMAVMRRGVEEEFFKAIPSPSPQQ